MCPVPFSKFGQSSNNMVLIVRLSHKLYDISSYLYLLQLQHTHNVKAGKLTSTGCCPSAGFQKLDNQKKVVFKEGDPKGDRS